MSPTSSTDRVMNLGSENIVIDSPSSAFLKLPVEVRLEIYRYLLSSRYIRYKIPYPNSRFETTYYTYHFYKAIMYTNRKIYQEAVSIFLMENLFVRFTTNHPSVRHILWESQGRFFLTHGDCAGYFRRCAMEVNHYCPQSWTTENHEECQCTEFVNFTTCLLVRDQLPNLLRNLRAYSQQGDGSLAKSSFRVNIYRNFDKWSAELGSTPVPPRIQTLLDPFKILYDLKSLDIKGRVNEEYKQSIIASAIQPEPTVAEIINAASAIKTNGDEAFRKHQYNLSLSLYTSAIRNFQVNRHCAEYTGYPITGEFAGMSIAHAVRLFQIRLHSCLAAALVKVREYRIAIDHAKAAIKHIVTLESPVEEWEGLWIPAADRAKPVLWGGLAYEGLGDLNRAIYGVGEALFHYPKKRLERDYKRLEAEMARQGIEATRHDFGKGTNWWIG